MSLSKMEIHTVRSKLALRKLSNGDYEVFTTIHGSGVYRWFKISEDTAHWYSQQFGIAINAINAISATNSKEESVNE